jgi:UMF1 family MFS transporter
MADRVGHKRSLTASIIMMVAAIGWMFLASSQIQFFMIGALAGFAMAGVQSVSRSMVGIATPQGRSAEFYGFFSVAGRTSSFIGPAVYGWVAAEAARGQAVDLAEKAGQRLAVLSIAVFLLVGLGLLMLVNEVRARRAAETAPSEL